MRPAIGAAALLLVACQPEQNPGENQQADNGQVPAARESVAPPDSTTNAASKVAIDKQKTGEKQAGEPLGSLPPSDAPLRFVGRWAVSAASCANISWRFTATSLSTPAGSQCQFSNVQKVPGGYDIDARCTAEGPETADRITLRFAESARAMLFESTTIADAGLVYCGK